MKKALILILLIGGISGQFTVKAQFLKQARKFIKEPQKTGFSEHEAADAIREALVKGTSHGVQIVSKVNGYFGDPELKIPFPTDARQMEAKLRSIGMGKKVDEAILSFNRAAEDAANGAKDIFISAIRNMSVQDAVGIVKGNNDAATQYLKRTTSAELTQKFKPVIKASLDKVQATKYWSDLVKAYDHIPFVKKINPNLTDYVTQKAIDGLFVMIAREEYKIRKDPVARTTDLLKKVFGNK